MAPALGPNLRRGSFLAVAWLGVSLPNVAAGQERFDKTEMVEAASRRRVDAQRQPPDEIEVEDDLPTAPPGYHLEHRARTGRAGVGGILLGLAWFPVAIGAMSGWSCDEERCADLKKLRPAVVPVIGPLIAAPGFCESAGCLGFLVADAALQGLGAYLLINGLVPRDLYVRNGSGEHRRPAVTVATSPTPAGAVFSLIGAF